jgi:catechol 2,3-dioxygenase-like lactoylglutathione lyase family enzyme
MTSKLLHCLLILPVSNLEKTADYYTEKLKFTAVKYLEAEEPHICLYLDDVEIVLVKSQLKEIQPNRILHGTGYDGYFTTNDVESLYKEFVSTKVKIIKHLSKTDYGNLEFVIEDIDKRWIAVGLKSKAGDFFNH